MRNLLLIMSISGSILFLLYALLLPLTKRYCSSKWRYGILKITTLFFLFPLPYFKYYFLYCIEKILSFLNSPTNLNRFVNRSGSMGRIFLSNGSFFLSTTTKTIIYILVLFLLVSFTIVGFQLFTYTKFQQSVMRYSLESINSAALLKKIENAKQNLKIKQSIDFYESEYSNMPMTLGLFRAIVILPKQNVTLSDKETEYILFHELLHIKHKDVCMKFLGLLVIALHWFNPVSYLLFFELCCMSEIYCDFQVTKELAMKNKKEYGVLLINMSAEDTYSNKPYVPVSLLGSTKNITKKRLKVLKNQKLKHNKFVAGVLTFIMCLTASITVFAYEPVEEWRVSNSNDWIDADISEISFYHGENKKLHLPYEFYFTDFTGKIYEVKEAENRKACPHDFVKGYFTKHTKDKKGGCKVQYFDGESCTICGNKRKLVCFNTETNTTCPH